MAGYTRSGKTQNARRPAAATFRARPRARLLLVAALTLAAGAGGCTRHYFRTKADTLGMVVLKEKSQDPRWSLDGYHVYPDPRSRFADPTDPDRPPMPPDDEAAYDLSPNPQKPGKAGVAYVEGKGYLDMLAAWDAQNRAEEEEQKKKEQQKEEGAGKPTEGLLGGSASSTAAAEELIQELAPPVRRDGLLPAGEKRPSEPCQKPYLIKLEQSVDLALINSREYQTRREALFLAALPVTLERFAFSSQFYALATAFRERSGSQTPGGPANDWRVNSLFGVSKLFSTGALLLFNFANQTVFNLGGLVPGTVSQSTINLDVIQPLLRGGGRAVTLEPLTQAERNLLYSVRDFARFRQEFFVFIAAGQAAFIPGVQAGVAAFSGGTVVQPTPIAPFATPLVGTVAGGFPGIPVHPGDAGRLLPIRPSGATPQGFLSTILGRAQLTNQAKNVQSLKSFLDLFQVYLEGGIVNPVQVGQVEQTYLRSIETVLNGSINYRADLDQFKLQLGLPTPIPLELDDEPLEPMFQLARRYEQNSDAYKATVSESLQYGKPAEAGQLRSRLLRLLTASALARGTPFAEELPKRLTRWQPLSDQPRMGRPSPLDEEISRLRGERIRLQDRKAELEDKKQTFPAEEQRRLNDLEFEVDLGRFERALRQYEARPWEAIMEAARQREVQAARFLAAHHAFLTLLEGAVRDRLAQIRRDWPALPPACVEGVDLLSADEEEAFAVLHRTSLANRLDLMNQRAQLVDAWRKIAVAANALLGTFNVEYHMTSLTPPAKALPFAFSGSRTTHQLILNGQLPLVRVFERNAYRSTLIAYQQERRSLMLAQDNVLFAVRLDMRQLRAAAFNYQRVQKRAIELAYMQVDQALQAFSQPQAPPGPSPVAGAVGPPSTGGGGGDPAALTQQLLSTQNSLVNAQNDLYNTWVSYLTNRMSLFRDLGLMPLDNRGVWIDAIATCDCNPGPSSGGERPGDGRQDDRLHEQLPDPRALPGAGAQAVESGR